MAILHDDEPVEEFNAPPRRFPGAKALVAGTCLLATLWLARDLPIGRWLGVGGEAPPPVMASRLPSAPQPVSATPAMVPPQSAATQPQPSPPAAILSALPPSIVANEAPLNGTDPTRATLIDQIGALQMQLVLARLKRELAQTQAETAKLAPDLAGEASGVEALLDRMAERDGVRGGRGLAVQAVFGRDGEWAARLMLPGEGARVVRTGDLLADRWRVESIDERSVVLVALHGEARQVLRPGVGMPRASEFDSEAPTPATRPAKAATPPAASPDAAIAQAPIAAQMLRPR